MKGAESPVQSEYLVAFHRYLSGSDEAGLVRAYRLGRIALESGLGLLDLLALHNQALEEHLESRKSNSSSLTRAAEFLSEALSPFEMAQRGYQDSIQRLKARNEELVRAKEAAELAHRELEAFSYTVSHDLRAPLRSIDGFTRAIQEDSHEKLDAQGKQHLNYVRDSVQRMRGIIDDLLMLARVTRTELNRESVDLSMLARRIIDRFKNDAPDRKARIRIQAGIVATGDIRFLELLLENLFANAWKYTSKSAETVIEFGTIADSQPVQYFVRDNGVGFDMRHADKLFQPFQRLHSQTEFEGTGIGLSTVERIVRRHGGQIWAEGRVNHGATFYFTLESLGNRK